MADVDVVDSLLLFEELVRILLFCEICIELTRDDGVGANAWAAPMRKRTERIRFNMIFSPRVVSSCAVVGVAWCW